MFLGKIKKAMQHGFLMEPNFPFQSSEIEGISYDTNTHTLAYIATPSFRRKGNRIFVSCNEIPLPGGNVYAHVRPVNYQPEMKHVTNKIPLNAVLTAREGEPVKLLLSDDKNNEVKAVSSYIAEKAMRQVTGNDSIYAQLSRLGNSWFTLARADIHNEGCMIPVSVLNQLRQEGIKKLEILRQEKAERAIPVVHILNVTARNGIQRKKETPALVVRTNDLNRLDTLAELGIKHIIFGGESYNHSRIPLHDYVHAIQFAEENGIQLTCALPRIIGAAEEEQLHTFIVQLSKNKPDAIQISHPGMLLWMEDVSPEIQIEAAASWNIFNGHAIRAVENFGISACYVSQELTLSQIRDIVAAATIPIGVQVYGRTEVMVSEYCVINAAMTSVDKRHCPAPCRKGSYMLKDEHGRLFPVKTDEYCRMHVLNCKNLDMRPYMAQLLRSGISRFCIDARGNNENLNAIICDFIRLMDGENVVLPVNDQTVTRGHFFRGVL